MNQKYFNINREGHSVRCKLYCNDIHSVKDAVIFGHGFGGHKDNKAAERFAETLLEKRKNCAVLTFNWPAHGDDVKKRIDLDDCTTYLKLVIAYAQTELHAEELYAHATSFGGYLFLKYISEHPNPFKRLAFRCPAVNMYDVLADTIMKSDEYEKVCAGKDVQVGFDRKITVSKQFLTELQNADITKRDYLNDCERILILHGTKDEIVPFAADKAFCEENLIEFLPVQNADHRFQDPALMGLAIKETIRFLFA